MPRRHGLGRMSAVSAAWAALVLSATAYAQPVDPNLFANWVAAEPVSIERRVFEIRLTRHLACWWSWLDSTVALDGEQHSALAGDLQRRMPEVSEKHWVRTNRAPGSTLVPHFPVLFVESTSPLSRLTQSSTVQGLLRKEQAIKLQDAVDERQGFQYAASRDYAVAILDAEVFLTLDQRAAVSADQEVHRERLTEPYFAAHPSTGNYLPYQSIAGIVSPTVLPRLSDEQRQRLIQLESIAAKPRPSLSFRRDEPRDVWDERLKEHIQSCRKEVSLKLTLRASVLEREGLIAVDKADRLRLVAKSVASDLGDDMQSSIRTTLDVFETRMREDVDPGNDSPLTIHTVNSALDSPQNLPAWIAACGSLSLDHGDYQRWEANRLNLQRQARDRAVLAMLDRELWLLPGQRDQLLSHLSAALPPVESVTPNREPLREAIWLAHVFCLTDAGKVQELLTAPQWEAWQEMQACTPLAPGAPPTTANVLMRNDQSTVVRLLTNDGIGWDPVRHGRPWSASSMNPRN